MPSDTSYSLADLADLADVTPRTIRYYIAQGLLASPARFGPSTRYPAGHLARLRLIRQLQREHLPLAEIRARLARLGDPEVARVLETATSPRATESAVDYIRAVLAGGAVASMAPSPAEPPPSSPLSGFAAAPSEPQVLKPDRSQWDRVLLTPDIELHVRRPLSRLQNRRVERLIAIARELLEEDKP